MLVKLFEHRPKLVHPGYGSTVPEGLHDMLALPAEPFLEARPGVGHSQALCHSGASSGVVKYHQGFVLETAQGTVLVLRVHTSVLELNCSYGVTVRAASIQPALCTAKELGGVTETRAGRPAAVELL